MGKFSLKLLPDEPGYPEENPASVAYVNRKLRWTQSECNESMDTIEKALDSKADLGADGKVLESQLPFIGNNVQAYDSKESFPEEGTTNVIYIDNATDKLYKWNDTEYIEVSAGTPVTLDTDSNKITVGDTSIEVAPKSHVDDTTNPHKVTAEQVDAYTKSEVDSKLNGKLDSSAVSDWAKKENKPTYTASEVGVTLDEKTNEITIDKKSITPLTTESDPVFTKWKGGTSVELGDGANASGNNSTALGYSAYASVENSTALGYNSYTATDNTLGLAYTPAQILLGSTKTDKGATAKSLQEYLNEKADTSAIPTLDGYAKTDDVRDKLDLSVYSKYTEWYITDDDYRNVLAKMDGGGQTFTCDAEVYSGQEHLNKITVNVSYDTTTGKVSKVSGEAQTWYPLSVGDQPPAYTSSEFIPDSDAVNMINDPNKGCFTAISYYFDENGQRQSGVVRFKVEYTGAPQELDDTLVKTSDLTFANIKSSSLAAPTLADGLGYLSNGEETVYKNGLVNYWYNGHVADFKFPDPSTLEGSSDNSYTLATTTDLSQYRKLTDDTVYNEDGTDSGNTYVDSKTFNDLAAKVDTANATLEEVV